LSGLCSTPPAGRWRCSVTTPSPANDHHTPTPAAERHEVRKKAKRLRYAADSATVLHGDRAKKLTARARAIQESLGSHQDSVVARAHLTKLAHTARTNHEDGFTYGRLHALEEQASHHAESQYEHAIAKLTQRRLDRWLRH